MFASMFGSEPAPKLQGNPKENLKYLVSNFNNSYKSDEEKLRNIDQIWERVKSYGTLTDSLLDVKSLVHVSGMWIKKEISKGIDMDLNRMEKCLHVLHLVASVNSDSFSSVIENSKLLNLIIELIIQLDEIDCSMEELFAGISQLANTLVRKDYGSSLKPLYDIAFSSSDMNMVKKTAISIIDYSTKTKRFLNELSYWKGQNGLYAKLMRILGNSAADQKYSVGMQYIPMAIHILKTSQEENVELVRIAKDASIEKVIVQYLIASNGESQTILLENLLEMAFLGVDAGNEPNEGDLDSPFQMDGFELPFKTKEGLFVNYEMIEIYYSFYVGSVPNVNADLRNRVTEQILQIVQTNPRNYFEICSNSKLFFEMIEQLDNVESTQKNIILAVIKHVAIVLNYVPFKEICLLFVHLHGTSLPDTTQQVVKCLEILIEASPNWRHTLQELGSLDILSSYFSKLMSPECRDVMIQNFSSMSHYLIQLLQLESNFLLFSQRGSMKVIDLLQNQQLRGEAAQLVKTILKISGAIYKKEDVDLELKNLLKLFGHSDLSTKTEILKLMGELVVTSSSFQARCNRMNMIETLFQYFEYSEHESGIYYLCYWFKLLRVLSGSTSDYFFRNSSQRYDVGKRLGLYTTEQQCIVMTTGLLAIAFDVDVLYQCEEQQLTIFKDRIVNVGSLSLLFSALSNGQTFAGITMAALKIVNEKVSACKLNQVMLGNSDFLDPVITWIGKDPQSLVVDFESLDQTTTTGSLLKSLCKTISTFGITELALRTVVSSIIGRDQTDEKYKFFLYDLLLNTLHHERTPCYFEFGPKNQSFISLEDYSRSFPPQVGYTFMGWIKMDTMKSAKPSVTPVMSIIDNSGVERLAVYIGSDMGFYLRTQKGNTRLGDYTFQEKKWTHFAIAHQKPMLTASTVDLFINGALVISQKCNYLGHPGSIPSVTTYIGSFGKTGYDSCSTLYLGPVCFIEAYLIDAQTVSIIYDIGFEYTGNWQGSWAAYLVGNSKLQTKSTKLMDDEIQSPIFNQIATFTMSPGKTSYSHVLNIPEESILFSICAQNHFNNMSEYAKSELLSSNLAQDIENAENNVVINACFTKPGKQNGNRNCLANINKDLLAVNPKRLIDGIWTLGGCAILIKFVEQSNSSEELHRTLSILVNSVSNNWRSLAEMERKSVYEILAFILKTKKELITISALDLIFILVSNETQGSTDCSICNPNAIKFLVLDIELWRTSLDAQRYYLNHLTDLMVHSNQREENIHTLNKMALIKRFLFMIDQQILAPELLSETMNHIKILAKNIWSGDTVKLLCTFLINTLPKASQVERDITPANLTFNNFNKHKDLYYIKARNFLLQAIIEIVDQNENYSRNAEDLLQAVTSRWILLFIGPNLDSDTVVLATRLIYYTWKATENNITKFKETFILLKKLISCRFDDIDVYLPLWAILCNATLRQTDWKASYDEASLMAMLSPKENSMAKTHYCSTILPSILSLTNSTIAELQKLLVIPQADLNPVQVKSISHYSATVRTTLSFLSLMYHQIPQMRDAILNQYILDDIVSTFYNLVNIQAEDYTLKLDFVPDTSFDVSVNRFLGEDVNKVSKFSLIPRNQKDPMHLKTKEIISSLLEFLMVVMVDSILDPVKPLLAVDYYLKAIPNVSQLSKNQFQEFVLLCTMDSLAKRIQKRKQYLHDYRIISNLNKFSGFLVDLFSQGFFATRKDTLFDFILLIVGLGLENEPVESPNKKQIVDYSSLFKPMNRMVILLMNQFQGQGELQNQFIIKIIQYQKETLHPQNSDQDFVKCFVSHFYDYLFSVHSGVRDTSRIVWKHLLLLKPVQIFAILRSSKLIDYKELVDGFSKLLSSVDQFNEWVGQKKTELDQVFKETVGNSLTEFTTSEQKTARESSSTFEKHWSSKLKKNAKRQELEIQLYNRYVEKSKAWILETGFSESTKRKKYKTEYNLMQVSLETEWKEMITQLNHEKAILCKDVKVSTRWKLDFTEAKTRVRKKMRRNQDLFVHYQSKAEKVICSNKLHPGSTDAAESNDLLSEASDESPILNQQKSESPLGFAELMDDPDLAFEDYDDLHAEENSEAKPQRKAGIPSLQIQAENSNANVIKGDEPEWEEVALEENENQKIQRLLAKGDQVIEVVNCARLIGLELIECICIISQQNIYIIDNYFKRADGEILDIDEATLEERNLYHMIVIDPNRKQGTKPECIHQGPERHSCRQCGFQDIKEVHKRLYLFRNVGLEMFLIDGRNFFLSFWNAKARDAIYNKLLSKTQNNADESVAGVSNPGGGSVLQQALFGGSPLNELTQKWVNREISNLAYLMHLNTLAGRSYNDLTQYPTFPWVIADYDSETLDLNNPATFRNLLLPMGGQGENRAEQFRDRYDTWDDPAIPGCHYGTHYSSSMIVCSFLIRLEPFTQQYLKLQGGHFDHPDRLFHSIPQSWASASRLNTTDVRELIPEFFYLPQFLVNLNEFNFGTKQTGEVIHNVVLPKWAKQSPYLFVKLHREALESEYVSENIHHWIDLVFGSKQQGEEAAKSLNVFHYLSYEGAVDMDKIEDPIEKQSTISIIHNFGQTPKQLFKKPHPKRNVIVDAPLRIEKYYRFLTQSASLIKDLGGKSVSDIRLNSTGHVLVTGSSKIFVPNSYSKYLEWGHLDDSLRIVQCDSNKEAAVFESLHIGRISCAIFADNECLVTGGEDTTVCIWNFVSGKRPSVDLEACLRGHRKQVTNLAISRSFSVIVSGSEDCTVIIWDLNRQQYVRCLEGHQKPIVWVAVSDNSGDIVSCDGSVCMIWDINGTLLAEQNISLHNDMEDHAGVCIPFEGRSAEVFDTELIFTGHDSGKIRIWKKMFNQGGLPWKLELVHILESRYTDPISYLSFSVSARTLFSADSTGKVTTWNLPDGSQTEIHFTNAEACNDCKTKFAVLGRKANCKSCGTCVCPQCLQTVPEKSYKLCSSCYTNYNLKLK